MFTYKLVYSKTYHMPLELKHKVYWAVKQLNKDMNAAAEQRRWVEVILLWKCKDILGENQAMAWQENPKKKRTHFKPTSITLQL